MENFVIITGASKGIGRSIANTFSLQNWKVINISRTPCDMACVNFIADISFIGWEKELNNNINNLISNPNKICLVHNAARYEKDTVHKLDVEKYRNTIMVNLISPSILNQIILPIMEKGSSIIYIGSTLSSKAVKGSFSYVTTKHACVGMMKATCQDLDGTGIHTACVCPGFTDTKMLLNHLNHDHNKLEQIKNSSTAKRLIEPQEIAELVLYCATHPVINGSVIHANLGQIEY